ncbi:hypothetical protein SOVF_171350 [Spinacia oleracea]|nr:hypothetical protein SOVF_171350 [Spinacia oleracea]
MLNVWLRVKIVFDSKVAEVVQFPITIQQLWACG